MKPRYKAAHRPHAGCVEGMAFEGYVMLRAPTLRSDRRKSSN